MTDLTDEHLTEMQKNARWIIHNTVAHKREAANVLTLIAALRKERAAKRAVEDALRAVPLTITSCHGHGGWYVCPAEHCHGRSDDPLKMEHKSGCYVPKLRAALQQKEPEA